MSKCKRMPDKWNGLVECVSVIKNLDTHKFKVGRTYMIKNGKLIDGNSRKSATEFKDLAMLNDGFFYATFKKVGDETD